MKFDTPLSACYIIFSTIFNGQRNTNYCKHFSATSWHTYPQRVRNDKSNDQNRQKLSIIMKQELTIEICEGASFAPATNVQCSNESCFLSNLRNTSCCCCCFGYELIIILLLLSHKCRIVLSSHTRNQTKQIDPKFVAAWKCSMPKRSLLSRRNWLLSKQLRCADCELDFQPFKISLLVPKMACKYLHMFVLEPAAC